MTKIVDALNRIARQCSVKAPSSWVSATRDDHKELRDDFLLETVEDILDRVDLPSPVAGQTTITGTGAETYSLPDDFRRIHRDEFAVYDVSQDRPCVPVSSDGDWSYVKDVGTTGVIRFYRQTGYDGNFSISFYEEPSAAVDITVSYSTKNWMANSGGTAGDMFTDEDDVLLLPRRVVEVGAVWRYRRRRGLEFGQQKLEYETYLERLSNDTRSRRTVYFGEPERLRWQDLVPVFIPPS